jgi:predicted PurR-regulated permease PerM
LLLVAAVVYLSFKVAVALRLLVLPFIAAILLCALLQPLASLLRGRLNMPNLLATWVTVLAAIGVLTGVGILITNQVQAGYPKLSAEVLHTVHVTQKYLAGPPFRLNETRLTQISKNLVNYLAQHKTVVAGTVLTGGKYAAEVLAGLILTVFITFFLLKDGKERWQGLVISFEKFRYGNTGEGYRVAIERSGRASGAAWTALVNYIRGTTIIALIHAVLIGIALWALGVPLIMPIAILVFIAAYVPLIGILIVGAIAILITLATQGGVAAVILLAVFLAENQLESHLLQPLVIGRAVRLHPLEVIVVLAVGGIVAGIPGAIIAVPTAAVLSAAWRSNHPSQQPRRTRPAPDETGDPEHEPDQGIIQ